MCQVAPLNPAAVSIVVSLESAKAMQLIKCIWHIPLLQHVQFKSYVCHTQHVLSIHIKVIITFISVQHGTIQSHIQLFSLKAIPRRYFSPSEFSSFSSSISQFCNLWTKQWIEIYFTIEVLKENLIFKNASSLKRPVIYPFYKYIHIKKKRKEIHLRKSNKNKKE